MAPTTLSLDWKCGITYLFISRVSLTTWAAPDMGKDTWKPPHFWPVFVTVSKFYIPLSSLGSRLCEFCDRLWIFEPQKCKTFFTLKTSCEIVSSWKYVYFFITTLHRLIYLDVVEGGGGEREKLKISLAFTCIKSITCIAPLLLVVKIRYSQENRKTTF